MGFLTTHIQLQTRRANHFVLLVMLEDGIASVYDSAGKKVSNDLMRQLRSIFGGRKRINTPPVYPQTGNNCLVNSAAIATDFCLSKKEPQTANWEDGVILRQWFKRILFKESTVSSAPRKRGVRSSARTSPPDAFILT